MQRLAGSALSKQEQPAKTTAGSIADGVLTVDTNNKIICSNAVAYRLLNTKPEMVIGKTVETVLRASHIITGEHLPPEYFSDALRHRKTLSKALMLSDTQGRTHPVYCRCSYTRSDTNEISGAIITLSDLTEEQRLRAELHQQANYDHLTQLPNRREFESRISQAIDSAKDAAKTYALCYLDLDQFKIVNENSGHGAGDEVLRQIAQLLQTHLERQDTVARLGGDEFGVLFSGTTLEQAEATLDEMRCSIANARFFWEDHAYTTSMSAGLVLIDESTTSVMTALRDADNACYIAKESGRNRVHVALPHNQELAQRREKIQSLDLIAQALEQDRFVLFAQNIEPTVAPETDTPLHVEILLRMRGESGDIIAPSSFLPAAEQYGICSSIDRWVIRNTLRSINQFVQTSHVPHIYSINLSGQSLGASDFLDFMLEELFRFTPPKHLLCFEITETAAIADMGSALKLMESLRELGCQFALDDFGSGLSSFSYLKNLPVDYLKIDGQFIRDMLSDPLDLAMVRSINDIGHTMGIKTIAEFVDNPALRHQLQLLGVDFVQGYLLGKPQPLDQLHNERLNKDVTQSQPLFAS